MSISLERFLEQTAKRGSWYGGGSAAALTCALAAALLEKLANRSVVSKAFRSIRTNCAQLTKRDAQAFERVIKAYSGRNQRVTQQALKRAIEIPMDIYASSRRLLMLAGSLNKTLAPRYRVDLECAMALARASGEAARLLVEENLSWLGDHAYRLRTRRKLSRLR